MAGHSLGGSITTAYASWDFNGRAGARDLDGLVYIDGGSGATALTPEAAAQSLSSLGAGTPWLTFGGIPRLPSNLKSPVRVTNEGGYGSALDTETSPPSLAAAQAHLGRLAPSGEPRGWRRAGELTSVQRFAAMFSGSGFKGLDGTAWYHTRRLTIDSGAVAAGNANPAQPVLDVRATHGDDLDGLRIYAFGAALGGERVLDAARLLARQSGIPRRHLTLVERSAIYSHNDPNSAGPANEFVKRLVPWLARVARRR